MRHEAAVALRDAARSVLEQIHADIEQLDGPARRILERFAKDLFCPELRVSKVIEEFKAARTQSLVELELLTACTPAAYLKEARLEIALRLLPNEDLPIQQIAALVGFPSAAAFRRALIRWAGTRPSEYRARAVAARSWGASMPEPARLRRRALLRVAEGRAEPAEIAAILDEEARARGKPIGPPWEVLDLEGLEREIAKLWWERLREMPFEEARQELLQGCPLAKLPWPDDSQRMRCEIALLGRRRARGGRGGGDAV